ncbi:MAG: hypothetical protein ACJ707_00935 [Nitrososphaera sp.]
MENTKPVLVIYRLKFKSKSSFQSAIETLNMGQRFQESLRSFQRSFSLKNSQPNFPTLTGPEINICKDDLVIYLCSYEIRPFGYSQQATAPGMSRVPYYYELLLRGTFGSIAELSIAAAEQG